MSSGLKDVRATAIGSPIVLWIVLLPTKRSTCCKKESGSRWLNNSRWSCAEAAPIELKRKRSRLTFIIVPNLWRWIKFPFLPYLVFLLASRDLSLLESPQQLSIRTHPCPFARRHRLRCGLGHSSCVVTWAENQVPDLNSAQCIRIGPRAPLRWNDPCPAVETRVSNVRTQQRIGGRRK